MNGLQSFSTPRLLATDLFVNPLLNLIKQVNFSHKKTFKRNDYIYLPQGQSKEIYLIVKGSVHIGKSNEEGKEMIKMILKKDDIFGELSLIGEKKRIDYAQAKEETILKIISVQEMNRLMEKYPALNFCILDLIASRLLDMEKRLTALVFKNSRTRVIDFLVSLAKKKGQRIGYEILIKDFFTHHEIGSLTATSRQTVTTVLNEMKKKNILTFNRRRLLIRDLSLLKAEI